MTVSAGHTFPRQPTTPMTDCTPTSPETELAALLLRLQQGDVTAEAAFTAVFEQCANQLLLDDPQQLLELVQMVANVPLHTAVARQQRAYFYALALRKTEQYTGAIAAFDALLAEPDLPAELNARALNSRAVAYELLGQPEAALNGYQQSLVQWQALGDERYQGMTRLNLGILAYKLRQYTEAENQLRQASAHFQALALLDWQLAAVNELGLVHRDRGQWKEALACFDQLISHHRQDGSMDNLAIGLQNRGEVLLFLGQLPEAEAALREAQALMASRAYQVDIHLYLGLIAQAHGQPAAAEAAYQAALSLAKTINRQESLPHIYYHLGDLRQRQADSKGAQAAWETAVTLIESSRQPVQDEGLKISLLGRWQQVYEALVLHALAGGDMAAAFLWAERSRARAFAEGITKEESAVVTLPQLQAAIPPDTAVLYYFTTGVLAWDVPLLPAIPLDNPLREHLLLPPRLFLFVITRNELTWHLCPLDPNKFAAASPRLLDGRRYLQPGVLSRLYDALLAPAGTVVDFSRLVIIPHGPLHQAPFAALLPLAGPSLTYAPNGALFARQAQPLPLDGATLAVGYNGAHRLVYAEAEAQMVARIMSGTCWLEGGAGKERLRHTAVTCRLLHFACHAFFDQDDPLASYLEIGGDERLTAREIAATWQLRAELVTLSACETGVSHILRGDEPLGLVRAFLVAGATAVLVTQWPVADLPTSLLMHRFYKGLSRRQRWNLPGALAEAQQWLRQATAAEIRPLLPAAMPALEGELDTAVPFAAPEHWAGFVLIGSGNMSWSA